MAVMKISVDDISFFAPAFMPGMEIKWGWASALNINHQLRAKALLRGGAYNPGLKTGAKVIYYPVECSPLGVEATHTLSNLTLTF